MVPFVCFYERNLYIFLLPCLYRVKVTWWERKIHTQFCKLFILNSDLFATCWIFSVQSIKNNWDKIKSIFRLNFNSQLNESELSLCDAFVWDNKVCKCSDVTLYEKSRTPEAITKAKLVQLIIGCKRWPWQEHDICYMCSYGRLLSIIFH